MSDLPGAAEVIAALRAENERLRTALESMVRATEQRQDATLYPDRIREANEVLRVALDNARHALAPKEAKS